MTPYQFGHELARRAGFDLYADALKTRDLHIVFLRANYGNPTAVMFAWNGSGPHLQTYMSIGREPNILFFNGKQIRSLYKRESIQKLMTEFFDEHGWVDQVMPPVPDDSAEEGRNE